MGAAVPILENFDQAKEVLEKTFECCPDALLVSDPEGRIVQCNPQMESMFGYSRSELLGQPIEDLIPERFRKIHTAHRGNYISQPRMRAMGVGLELYGKRKDGTEFPVDIMLSPVETAEGRVVLSVIRDITERKQSEQTAFSARLIQIQEEERKRIARELHDSLGQSLAFAKMNLDSLRRPEAAEKEKQTLACLADALNSCLTETRTISHLLFPPLLDELGLVSAVNVFVEGFSARSGIHVNLDIPPDLKRLPPALELGLFRILQESLVNVHRHSHSELVDIQLRLSAGEVTLEVRDHGQGMPAELLERFRANMAGRSVGLRGMQTRVSEMSGRFDIQSDKRGTLIRVTAPLPEEVKKSVAVGGKLACA